MIAALNDLDILAADIGNAYINADAREQVYFIAGDEFGTNRKGKRVIIIKALYGLNQAVLPGEHILLSFFMVWDTHPVWQILMFGTRQNVSLMGSSTTHTSWFMWMTSW